MYLCCMSVYHHVSAPTAQLQEEHELQEGVVTVAWEQVVTAAHIELADIVRLRIVLAHTDLARIDLVHIELADIVQAPFEILGPVELPLEQPQGIGAHLPIAHIELDIRH